MDEIQATAVLGDGSVRSKASDGEILIPACVL